jgi:hypothetical protein
MNGQSNGTIRIWASSFPMWIPFHPTRNLPKTSPGSASPAQGKHIGRPRKLLVENQARIRRDVGAEILGIAREFGRTMEWLLTGEDGP